MTARHLVSLTRTTVTFGIMSAACDTAPTQDLCASARDRIATCFPDAPSLTTCDPDTASNIASSSCESLEGSKSDNPLTCLWMPWLCATSPDTASKGTLTVSVARCYEQLGACAGVSSLPCAEVVVKNASDEVARGFTGDAGLVRFEGLAAGTYQVEVLDRAGRIADALVGSVSSAREEARAEVELGDEGVRVDLQLTADSEKTVTACSRVDVDLVVTNSRDEVLDPADVEWDWIVRYAREDGETDFARPFAIVTDESATAWKNHFGLSRIYPGTHIVELFRVEIPGYAQEKNPDYESLLGRYQVDDVKPVELSLEVSADEIPDPVGFTSNIVDPLAD